MLNNIIQKELPNRFRGSERKKTVVINNKIYLLKLPDPVREHNRNLSYINNSISEYLGCHILQTLGFDVQNTILDQYYDKEKKKYYLACACESIEKNGYSLGETADISLSDESNSNMEDTSFESFQKIVNKLNKETDLSKETIENFYYDLLIADCFIGNTDRHNRNWGILTHPVLPTKLAPIYDCGSSLSPLLSENDINIVNKINIAKDEKSIIHDNKKRLKWNEILQIDNHNIEKALKRVLPKINLSTIFHIIEETPCISEARKIFYKDILTIRYEQLLLPALYNKLNKEIRPSNINNPYEIYKESILSNLDCQKKNFIVNGEKYEIVKTSNKYAFILHNEEFVSIVPIRSNNDSIRITDAILQRDLGITLENFKEYDEIEEEETYAKFR